MWTQINLGCRNVVLKKCVLSINHLTFTQNIIWKMSRPLLRNISVDGLYNHLLNAIERKIHIFFTITLSWLHTLLSGRFFFMSINWLFISLVTPDFSKTKQWNYLFRGFIFKWIMVYQAVYFTILRYHSLRTRFADSNNVMPVWLYIL